MKHTIGVLMENKPGVLSRISTLLARRSFNIDSITAGTTRQPEVTRMTVVVEGDEYVADNAAAEIAKLEDVLSIERMTPGESTSREIMLIKLRVEGKDRSGIIDLAKVMDARIVDVTETTIVLEHADRPDKIDVLVNLLSTYEILDMARGGAIALRTGE
ncbi:MAG: acetolactate synthase small subunit [Clostridiales Family XIII bacterium]|jgi:acetolactate synthase-1/3 small subunit|nr:acetolactate synthase small subunit [Clostridiales Family XIII bacterium]